MAEACRWTHNDKQLGIDIWLGHAALLHAQYLRRSEISMAGLKTQERLRPF